MTARAHATTIWGIITIRAGILCALWSIFRLRCGIFVRRDERTRYCSPIDYWRSAKIAVRNRRDINNDNYK